MENNIRVITTKEELKIFSDLYRQEIISVYQTSSKPLTVKQVADMLGDNPGKVDYHVKKLLGIEILELDHIEAINGIQAKYYKLKKLFFEVNLRDDQNSKSLDHVDYVTQLLIKSVDAFKEELILHSERVKNDEVTEKKEGMLAKREVFLSPEEYQKVTDLILHISNTYSEFDKTKKKYSFMGGLIHVIEE